MYVLYSFYIFYTQVTVASNWSANPESTVNKQQNPFDLVNKTSDRYLTGAAGLFRSFVLHMHFVCILIALRKCSSGMGS